MPDSKPPKQQNGIMKTAITAVIVSAVITGAGAATTVKVIQSDVRHLDNDVHEANNSLDRHVNKRGLHTDLGDRVGQVEGRVTKLETITEERRRSEEKQWKTIQADVRDIKNELRRLREQRQN